MTLSGEQRVIVVGLGRCAVRVWWTVAQSAV